MPIQPSQISTLRDYVTQQYLGNERFSADEAKDFVAKVVDAGGGLTAEGRFNLQRLKAELMAQDVMSPTAVQVYERALAEAEAQSPFLNACAAPAPAGTGHPLAVATGAVDVAVIGSKASDVFRHVETVLLGRGEQDVISASEARGLIATLASGGLNPRRLHQLAGVRWFFLDRFSQSGLEAFDRALQAAIANSPRVEPEMLHPAREGLSLRHVPRSLDLSTVIDPVVRQALANCDLNNDNLINQLDQRKLGMSDEQWAAFMYALTLVSSQRQGPAPIPPDLRGKTICFSAVADKAKGKTWAEAMGATVVDEVTPGLDFLVVGNRAATGKDERANALNLLNEATAKDIAISDWQTFLSAANQRVPTGELPAGVQDQMLQSFDDYRYGHPDVSVRFADVEGNDQDGYRFSYSAGEHQGTAYAVRYHGGWVVTPVKVDVATLDAASEAMRADFDANFAPELADNGVSARELREMREQIYVSSAFFPHMTSDPYNLVDDYPVVFGLNNPTGSDHGFFCGIDPAAPAQAECYMFN